MTWAFDPLTRRPLIVIECNGRPLRCILDTGFTGWIWMHYRLAKRYKIRTETDERFADTASKEGCRYWIGYANRILIDPVAHEGMPIYAHDGREAEYALIGIRALADFVITIDCKDEFTRLMHVE